MLIRRAALPDVLPLARLLRELGWFAALQNETSDETAVRVRHHLELCLADDSHVVFVAESETGEVVGYTAVHWLPYLFLSGPEGFVSELFVNEGVRGSGVGSQLLAAVVAAARERGCARLQLVNFRHRESYLRHFYEKQGWQERPEAADFVFFV
ncbi:MAG: GNAT family N-acetyltransferase [Ardenticatenaceae bacterium]|nr:GNAT family N-acetyltransferase [Ardenticatenaceae bacterium]